MHITKRLGHRDVGIYWMRLFGEREPVAIVSYRRSDRSIAEASEVLPGQGLYRLVGERVELGDFNESTVVRGVIVEVDHHLFLREETEEY